ncbi:MAG: regulatory protein RecX, partial [Ornithinimicrobium sp.]
PRPDSDPANKAKPRRRNQHSPVDEAPDGMAHARQVALRQLALGPRTRQQLADKMRDRECPPEVIERVLERMTEVGLVDDEAYAHMLVRTKREGSGLAVRGLRHELRKKGVPEDLAEAAVADVEPEDERAQAEALVAARLPRLHGLDRDVQMRRLGGYLARKGYPAGVSFAVIRNALDQAPEHVRD